MQQSMKSSVAGPPHLPDFETMNDIRDCGQDNQADPSSTVDAKYGEKELDEVLGEIGEIDDLEPFKFADGDIFIQGESKLPTEG